MFVVDATPFQRRDHAAGVEQPRLDLEHVAVGLRIADARRHRIAAPACATSAVPGRQRRRQCLDAQARVGPQVMARDLLALADRDGIDIDLQHLCLRPELAAATRVVGERAADRDDEKERASGLGPGKVRAWNAATQRGRMFWLWWKTLSGS
ncbi:MAG: hypothetical protein ACT4P3_17710 [Betaproteobacteria bacterium]